MRGFCPLILSMNSSVIIQLKSEALVLVILPDRTADGIERPIILRFFGFEVFQPAPESAVMAMVLGDFARDPSW